MTDHCILAYEAQDCWLKAQNIISTAETQYEHGNIDSDEWYRRLIEAAQLQAKAAELEKQAVDAQVEYWKQKYLEEETGDEYYQRMHDERPY